jgi:hypothetical protein
MTNLAESVEQIQSFQYPNLGLKLAQLEQQFSGIDSNKIQSLCNINHITEQLILSAIDVKKALGQINEVIHAVGIIILLPKILESDEVIEYLSLGAGNTGKEFDLETNIRVAEFKFISWKGGSEAIRQNQLFKDFFYLAEAHTNKRRCLYVIGLEHPLKFLNGERAIYSSVCSRNAKLARDFKEKCGSKFEKVYEYYASRKHLIEIVDINKLMPSLTEIIEEL